MEDKGLEGDWYLNTVQSNFTLLAILWVAAASNGPFTRVITFFTLFTNHLWAWHAPKLFH